MYKVRKERLKFTPGTPLTAYLDTVTLKRYFDTKIIINHCQIITLTFAQIPVIVKDILYLTAVLNSCINPIIYGVYYFSERRLTRYPSTNTTRAMIHFSSRQYLTSYKLCKNFYQPGGTSKCQREAIVLVEASNHQTRR